MKTWHRIVLTIIIGFSSPVLAVLGLNMIPAINALDESIGFLVGMIVGILCMMGTIVIFKPFKHYY